VKDVYKASHCAFGKPQWRTGRLGFATTEVGLQHSSRNRRYHRRWGCAWQRLAFK